MNRDQFDSGPPAHVHREGTEERPTLVFVRELRHPPEKVWAALTDPGQLKEWAPFVPNRNLATLGPAVLNMSDGEPKEDYPAVVSRAIAPQVLEYTWGDDRLVWELEPAGTGTRLTLRHTVTGRGWMPKVAAGWHICLAVAERFLDGRPVGRIVAGDAMKYGWQELHDTYAGELGVPVSADRED